MVVISAAHFCAMSSGRNVIPHVYRLAAAEMYRKSRLSVFVGTANPSSLHGASSRVPVDY
jgi:hypothetical protein